MRLTKLFSVSQHAAPTLQKGGPSAQQLRQVLVGEVYRRARTFAPIFDVAVELAVAVGSRVWRLAKFSQQAVARPLKQF